MDEPIIDLESDHYFMGEALRQATKAYEADEVPVGAVIVRNGRIIARAYNQVELLKDATAHAEMLAVTQAEQAVGDWRLTDCTLYVTKEPCPMCAGAIVHVRLARVVFGAPDPKGGAAGSALNLLQFPTLNHRCPITAGVREPECRALLQSFFAEKARAQERRWRACKRKWRLKNACAAMLKIFKALFAGGDELKFDASRVCSECGSPLYDEATARLHDSACPNLDCPARIRRLIAHWCSPEALNIPIHDRLIPTLVSQGLVRDVAELYRLKLRELEAFENVDPSLAKEIFDALTASTKREAWRVLFGLSIPNVTTADAQALLRKFGSVDNVMAAGIERLRGAEGVSQAAATGMAQWTSDPVNRRLVKRLFKAGLSFKV